MEVRNMKRNQMTEEQRNAWDAFSAVMVTYGRTRMAWRRSRGQRRTKLAGEVNVLTGQMDRARRQWERLRWGH
jgi:hypothetical protein